MSNPLNNNPGMRSFSNKLDSVMKWGGYDDPSQSKLRASLHAGYHKIQHLTTGNPREHERAKDQWGVVTGGATDNLKRYVPSTGETSDSVGDFEHFFTKLSKPKHVCTSCGFVCTSCGIEPHKLWATTCEHNPTPCHTWFGTEGFAKKCPKSHTPSEVTVKI